MNISDSSLAKLLDKKVVSGFTVTVLLISALMMMFIIYDLTNTKHDVATTIIEQKSERVMGELDEFFNPIRSQLSVISPHLVLENIWNLSPSDLNGYFIPIIDEYPQISSVGLATSSGREFDILPDTGQDTWLSREVNVNQWGMIEKWTRLDYTNDISAIEIWEAPLKVDPREREWFIGAINNTMLTPYWSEPYIYMTGYIGLTVSTVFQETSNPDDFSILAIDTTLEDLTLFSQRLSLSYDDEIFILTGNSDRIIGLPGKYAETISIDELHTTLLSDPKSFGSDPLLRLIENEEEKMIRFRSSGVMWRGVLKNYQVSGDHTLKIAILIPERNFSASIDRTLGLMQLGFLTILVLSFLLYRNNRMLLTTSKKLNSINHLISEQKHHLLVEVHHRVKNNLAIMSALVELERLSTDHPETHTVLGLIADRVRSMAVVHEILYSTDKENRIPLTEIIQGILKKHNEKYPNTMSEILMTADSIKINVNQALTYALLLNEIVAESLSKNVIDQITIQLDPEFINKENILTTNLKIRQGGQIKTSETMYDSVGRDLIVVLVDQLKGTVQCEQTGNVITWKLRFTLEDIQGVTSNQNYH